MVWLLTFSTSADVIETMLIQWLITEIIGVRSWIADGMNRSAVTGAIRIMQTTDVMISGADQSMSGIDTITPQIEVIVMTNAGNQSGMPDAATTTTAGTTGIQCQVSVVGMSATVECATIMATGMTIIVPGISKAVNGNAQSMEVEIVGQEKIAAEQPAMTGENDLMNVVRAGMIPDRGVIIMNPDWGVSTIRIIAAATVMTVAATVSGAAGMTGAVPIWVVVTGGMKSEAIWEEAKAVTAIAISAAHGVSSMPGVANITAISVDRESATIAATASMMISGRRMKGRAREGSVAIVAHQRR
jgi:hypothetical protein